ncbi:heterogeneous nuclear ribonucleoprotein A/B/D [Paragonimus westermani]|uniref:Heterogeneous nuclear ribonucleoprotein A/B/D n=1 Tax=Paragonimus westermani TaxID=34504 RepID=A0A5J4NI18_9TREM|nr:heterogeneous nuclear ribonucleoprotein A/B/D [Paragonimus westermani]
MPPIESSRVMNEASEQNSHDLADDSDGQPEATASSANCEGKPANGDAEPPNDDTDDDSRKLFVGGLSWKTTEGTPVCLEVLVSLLWKMKRVLGVSEHWLNNKKIDPKKAKPSREHLRKVFVGGIDPDVTEDQIRDYFSAFGKVESLDLPFDTQKGKRKHYIFVSFATEAAARRAIANERQEIFGRQCDVRVAVTREEANRQKLLKQWLAFFAQSNAYAGYTYNDFAAAYPGYDPYGPYNYYTCDYYDSTAAVAAAASGFSSYPGLTGNQFRGLSGGPKINQTPRNCVNTTGSNNTNHLLSIASSPGSLPNNHSQQTPSNVSVNSNLRNPLLDYNPPLTSGIQFVGPHVSQSVANMVASVTTGHPHP